ncbi:hypothetical protein [Clostridium perfringens]|uniref:Uncharacterized protein n=2 Tax=Clostridium perfringens TaxID=1502 RepID=A0A140GQW4_CLOPF|nr:hypothetical protein [Clostridium perfringens]AMN30923.1 hypothetical protein JFP838_pA0007 [Clostridium perfringens]
MKRLYRNLIYYFSLIYILILDTPLGAFADGNKATLSDNFKKFSQQYNIYIGFFIAIGILTGILGIIVNFMRLAKSATNPRERKIAINNIMIAGVTTGLLMNISFVLVWYYHVLL